MSDVVQMVYCLTRPLAKAIQPRKTMGPVLVTVNIDVRIPAMVHIPGDISGPGAEDVSKFTGHAIYAPRKHTSVWVIAQKLAQSLYGKIVSSHDAPQLPIGQRPADVDASRRLRHYMG